MTVPLSPANLCLAKRGVRVGEVDSCRVDLVELLALARDGVRKVDEVEDLWPAEAGDLPSTRAGDARE